MKNITTYAEAKANIEQLKALRKELRSQEKEVKEALLSVSFISKYDMASQEAKALAVKLENILEAINTQFQFSEDEFKKARKVAWHFKTIEAIMNGEPEPTEVDEEPAIEATEEEPKPSAKGKKKAEVK